MNIYFMCVANSARSQLAEGLAHRLLPTDHIESSGSKPGTLNPFAISVMNEMGIGISRHYSKSVSELPTEFIEKLDCVITLCAEEVCPILVTPSRKFHWPFPDPGKSGTDLEKSNSFRHVRDLIHNKLKMFRSEI